MADNIYQKLAKIRKLTEAIQKNKAAYNYKYVTEDEILSKVTAGMEKQGVSLIPNILHGSTKIEPYHYTKTKINKDTKLPYEESVDEILLQSDMEWIWVNNENPEERIVVPWVLIGHQANASMTFGSGLSYTLRYFLLKYFNVATVDDDVDAWKAKQEKAGKEEQLVVIKPILDDIDTLAQEYLKKFSENKAELTKICKEIMNKVVDGKKTANYFLIDDLEVALTLKARLEKELADKPKEKKDGI